MTAVRTGGKGMGGISLMVVERTEGLTTRRMDCMGVWASGTTYVTYEDVKVPVGNLLGRENKGFQVRPFLRLSRPLRGARAHFSLSPL